MGRWLLTRTFQGQAVIVEMTAETDEIGFAGDMTAKVADIQIVSVEGDGNRALELLWFVRGRFLGQPVIHWHKADAFEILNIGRAPVLWSAKSGIEAVPLESPIGDYVKNYLTLERIRGHAASVAEGKFGQKFWDAIDKAHDQ